MNGKMWTAALIAGLAIGVLSSIPLVSAVNVACCAWVWGGGIFSVWWYKRSDFMSVKSGQGLLMGLIAGIIGALISTAAFAVLGGAQMDPNEIMRLATERNPQIANDPDMQRLMEQFAQLAANGGLIVFVGCFYLIAYAIFGAIGGIIGAAIFKPKTA